MIPPPPSHYDVIIASTATIGPRVYNTIPKHNMIIDLM